MRKFAYIASIIFTVISLITLSQRGQGVTAVQKLKTRSFVAEGHNFIRYADGRETVDEGFKIFSGSAGERRTDNQRQGATVSSYCIPGKGSFSVKGESLQIRGECNAPSAKVRQSILANSRNVTIEDAVFLGHQVKHTSREYDKNGSSYRIETWGNEELSFKIVEYQPNGDQIGLEITGFNYQPVSADTFAASNLKPDFGWLERQLEAARANATVHAELEQQLGRLKLAFAKQ